MLIRLVSFSLWANVNNVTWLMGKQNTPGLRTWPINLTHFNKELNIFLEHKIFTKHCIILRLLFLNTFPYSVVYCFQRIGPLSISPIFLPRPVSRTGGGGANDRDSQNGHNFMRKKLQILQFYALSICDGFNGPWNS